MAARTVDPTLWHDAKQQMTELLVERVKRGGTITYNELAKAFREVVGGPNTAALQRMLYEIGEESVREHGILLPAIVVYVATGKPSPAFYRMTETLLQETDVQSMSRQQREQLWRMVAGAVYRFYGAGDTLQAGDIVRLQPDGPPVLAAPRPIDEQVLYEGSDAYMSYWRQEALAMIEQLRNAIQRLAAGDRARARKAP